MKIPAYFFRNLFVHNIRYAAINNKEANGFYYNRNILSYLNKKKTLVNNKIPGILSSLSEIIQDIEQRPKKVLFNSIILSALILFLPYLINSYLAILNLNYYLYFILFLGLVGSIQVFLLKNTHRIYLHYVMDGNKNIFYNELFERCRGLSNSSSIWHIRRILENHKNNYHGGAREIYDRSSAKLRKSAPDFLKTNITIWNIECKDVSAYFFPEFILLKNRDRYKIFPYELLSFDYMEKSYNESGPAPSDARIIGHAWMHPKKDGSPDRRFKNNPKIPVMLYSEILLFSSGNELLRLQISNVGAAYSFFRLLSKYAERHSEQRYTESTKSKSSSGKNNSHDKKHADWKYENDTRYQSGREDYDKDTGIPHVDIQFDADVIKAYATLGLETGSDQTEIKIAYRSMAKKFHPDVIINTGDNNARNAEDKMKEINWAYEKLTE